MNMLLFSLLATFCLWSIAHASTSRPLETITDEEIESIETSPLPTHTPLTVRFDSFDRDLDIHSLGSGSGGGNPPLERLPSHPDLFSMPQILIPYKPQEMIIASYDRDIHANFSRFTKEEEDRRNMAIKEHQRRIHESLMKITGEGNLTKIHQFIMTNYEEVAPLFARPGFFPSINIENHDALSSVMPFLSFKDAMNVARVCKSCNKWVFSNFRTVSHTQAESLRKKEALSLDDAKQLIFLVLLNHRMTQDDEQATLSKNKRVKAYRHAWGFLDLKEQDFFDDYFSWGMNFGYSTPSNKKLIKRVHSLVLFETTD